MGFSQHFKLLKKRHLGRKVKEAEPVTENVLVQCIKPKKEKLLVITDSGTRNHRAAAVMGAAYFNSACSMGIDAGFVSQEPKTSMDPADNEVKDAITGLGRGGIIILCLSNKLGTVDGLGKSFRGYSAEMGHRFISATSLGSIANGKISLLLSSMDIDYRNLRKDQAKAKMILDSSKEIRVTTAAGTDITMKTKKNSAITNDGNYARPGTGGNIPAGEVYLPPLKGKSDGIIVVNGTSRNEFGTIVVKRPFRITVEKGKAVSIEGGKDAKMLEASLILAEEKAKHPENVRHLAELGIGFNPKAALAGSMIIDEKAIGTCHFAIGSNYWFGGENKTIVHFDQVVKGPRINVDGKYMIG
ncbi:MAG: hypothetical protein DRO99_04150 [Candidatus Aenigmatarchaeota archaeon]|nr:MAG: hypothetical protein DRO99_04150 [Candidatus Aenigmarchaeota archaeon]